MYDEHPLQMTEDQPAVPSSAKAAGLVLIANGLLQLVATLVTGVGQGPVAFGGLFSVAIDFVVGGYLLADNEQALNGRSGASAFGLLFLPFVQYMTGGFIVWPVPVRPSRPACCSCSSARLACCGWGWAWPRAACACCFSSRGCSRSASGPTRCPATSFPRRRKAPRSRWSTGSDFKHRLQTTGDGWYIRKADLAKKDNRWPTAG